MSACVPVLSVEVDGDSVVLPPQGFLLGDLSALLVAAGRSACRRLRQAW